MIIHLMWRVLSTSLWIAQHVNRQDLPIHIHKTYVFQISFLPRKANGLHHIKLYLSQYLRKSSGKLKLPKKTRQDKAKG